MATNLVIVTLDSLSYSGESVGSNITVGSDIGGRPLSVNKKVSTGDSVDLGIEVGQFLSDAPNFDVVGNIQVVERDPVYNDSGDADVRFRVDLRSPRTQSHTVQVEVLELGGSREDATGVFTIAVRARVVPATRYVPDQGDGWLAVILESDRSRISLPAAVRVIVSRVDRGREHFTIAEGAYRGRQASVRLDADGSSLLSSTSPHTPAVRLVYSISTKTLALGRRKYETKDYPSSPWRKGIYDIEIPDAPHRGGLIYSEASRARTWFRIGHRGDLYIHTGAGSLGCITVLERGRWDDLYRALITARKDDGVSIGTLEVVD